MAKTVTRSTVNEQQYAAPAFPKSGFPLTHRKYSSYILGRMQVSGYQDLMPGDKIAGKNDGTFTFNNITTPMIPNVDVQQYNFMMMFRALDRTFERAFAPSKNNNMSASWKVPTISTEQIGAKLVETLAFRPSVNQFFSALLGYYSGGITDRGITIQDVLDNVGETLIDMLYGVSPDTGIVTETIAHLRSLQTFKNLYLDDVLDDIEQLFVSRLGSRENPIAASTDIRVFMYNYLDCLFTPFIGRYSYYADFHYNFLRPKDIYKLAYSNSRIGDSIQEIVNENFDSTPLSEYPLRAIYTIWYEYFRNVDLEPVSDNLPYWRDFGSTSVVIDNLAMLVYRPRPWYEDMFISAQIDDLSRHVWAPIVGYSSDVASYHTSPSNNLDANADVDALTSPSDSGSRKPSGYRIGWYDQVSGQNRSLYCPVPANINDILASTDKEFIDVYGLNLDSLRQAQQLERYLKRNYLFGDEYNDRMLAHYNSRVSDLRINRPELISQSFNSSDNKQEIANQDNGVANAGDRTATATIKSSGDSYTAFSEEFGILVHLITFMPTACYDGIHPQLMLSLVQDFPLPEFATNNEEFGRKLEIASSGLALPSDAFDMFGRYPAYHAWRQRVDQVGGMFLDEMQDCTFRRFWGFGDDSIPQLNYQFIHCRPSLEMFRNKIVYDSQIYGDIIHECYVERVLPTPVETI